LQLHRHALASRRRTCPAFGSARADQIVEVAGGLVTLLLGQRLLALWLVGKQVGQRLGLFVFSRFAGGVLRFLLGRIRGFLRVFGSLLLRVGRSRSLGFVCRFLLGILGGLFLGILGGFLFRVLGRLFFGFLGSFLLGFFFLELFLGDVGLLGFFGVGSFLGRVFLGLLGFLGVVGLAGVFGLGCGVGFFCSMAALISSCSTFFCSICSTSVWRAADFFASPASFWLVCWVA
jgi:hypothetical protein